MAATLTKLVPWTRPPTVHLFHPGVSSTGDYDDYGFHGAVNHESLTRGTSSDKHLALAGIASTLFSEGKAQPGDFVMMGYGARHNSTLVGCVIGEAGAVVSTNAFPTVACEDLAPRMVIPARLIPPGADPIKLFEPLFQFTDCDSTVLIVLPEDCPLIKALGCPTLHSGDAYVLGAHTGEFDFNTMTDIDEDINICDAELFFVIDRIDTHSLSRGWNDTNNRFVQKKRMFVSSDGKEWFGRTVRKITV